MGSTVRISYYGASATEPAGVNAEAGFTFGLADSLDSHTSPVTIPSGAPSGTGTAFAWQKNFALEITATAATAITNRQVKMASSPATGLFLAWKDNPTYTQPASGNKPTDSGSNGANPPTGYTAMTTSFAQYDNTSHSAGSTGRNGDFCTVVAAVDGTYAGGAGSATALPNLVISYDEA